MNEAIRILSTMGNKQPKAENTGTVINEIELQPATIENTDLIICAHVCTFIMIVQFLYKIYKLFHKNMKKKYNTAANI